MDTIFVADTTAMLRMLELVTEQQKTDFFDTLTAMVEKQTFCFPRAVVDDLTVRARNEDITSWSQGQGNRLRKFAPELEHTMWLMNRLQQDFGFEEGLEDVDGSEPSIIPVASYVRQCIVAQKSVLVVSEDRGSGPLRPTMEELCSTFDWPVCSVDQFFERSGISSALHDGR